MIVSVVPRILYNLWDMTVSFYGSAKSHYKVSKYMGCLDMTNDKKSYIDG